MAKYTKNKAPLKQSTTELGFFNKKIAGLSDQVAHIIQKYLNMLAILSSTKTTERKNQFQAYFQIQWVEWSYTLPTTDLKYIKR